MAWFEAVAHSVANSTLKLRYPMFKEARRQLAVIMLNRFDGAGLVPLLEGEAGRDYGSDDFAAVRESAAGAVLASLIGAPPGPWIDATTSAMERMIVNQRPSEGHRSTASDLCLAVSLLSHDPARVARAREIRWQYRPVITDCTFSALLLAEADAVTAGTTHELSDIVSLAAMGLQGNDVPVLALVMSRSRKPGPPESVLGITAMLDHHLTDSQGKLRVRTSERSRWHLVRSSGAPRLELTGTVEGQGGSVWAVPWALPREVLGPWLRLDELCRGEVEFGEAFDIKGQRAVADILSNTDAEIRLIARCEGDISLDPAGIDHVRARLPAGARWLQGLHPGFQARLTLEIQQAQPRPTSN